MNVIRCTSVLVALVCIAQASSAQTDGDSTQPPKKIWTEKNSWEKENREYKAQERKAKETARAEELKREYDLRQAEEKKLIEDGRKEREAEQAADDARYRAAAKREAALKAKCGDDYLTPKIGMTMVRLNECSPALKLNSQINRTDGVISVYTGRGLMVHVLGGRVVAWTRI